MKRNRRTKTPWLRRCTALLSLLLVVSLVSHALDNCAAHWGELSALLSSAHHHTPHEKKSHVCEPHDAPHHDVCGTVSEVATVRPSQETAWNAAPIHVESDALFAESAARQVPFKLPQFAFHRLAQPPPRSKPTTQFLQSASAWRAPPRFI